MVVAYVNIRKHKDEQSRWREDEGREQFLNWRMSLIYAIWMMREAFCASLGSFVPPIKQHHAQMPAGWLETEHYIMILFHSDRNWMDFLARASLALLGIVIQ